MAKVPIEKVRFAGLKKHEDVLLKELQKKSFVHFVRVKKEEVSAEDEHTRSRLGFFVDYMTKNAEKGVVEGGMLTGGKIVLSEAEAQERAARFAKSGESFISQAELAEETLVRSANEVSQLKELRAKIAPFVGIGMGEVPKSISQWVGVVPVDAVESVSLVLAEETHLAELFVVNRGDLGAVVRIVSHIDQQKGVQELLDTVTFQQLELSSFGAYSGQAPADAVRSIDEKIAIEEGKLVAAEQAVKDLTRHVNDARVAADIGDWDESQRSVASSFYKSKSLFSFEAWIPKREKGALEKWLSSSFVGEVAIEEVSLADDETPPAFLENNIAVRPFEALTNMYGAPLKKDLDPTPFLSWWFVLFFGICLSDVGYGALLVIAGAIFLGFGTFAESEKDTYRLMLYCGVSAVIGGVLLGGWFGMTPDQAPEFLTTVKDGAEVFRGQILNPTEGTGPLSFLIFSIYVGIAQLLFGVLVEAWKYVKQRNYGAAVMDSLVWFVFLVSLIGFAMASMGVLPLPVDPLKWATIATAGILVLTQGRHQKNWIMKPISGVLGLYGVMNYLSDVLSYSRLMALGLATGVIGSAMNTTAGVLYEMIGIPGVSHIVAIVVLIFGHGLNFALSLLGASIHSMRLQFIEFFGRFYTGGAEVFTPFVRKTKHIFIRS